MKVSKIRPKTVQNKNRGIANPQDPYQRPKEVVFPMTIKNSRIRSNNSPSNEPQRKVGMDLQQGRQFTKSMEVFHDSLIPKESFQQNYSKIKNEIDEPRLHELDLKIDEFFSTLNIRPFKDQVEGFIQNNILSNNVIYWEEISSVNRLYSDKYKVSINHHDTMIGSSFFQDNIQYIPCANKHEKWQHELESKIVDDRSAIIIFQLRSFDGSIGGLIEIQKKYAEPQFTHQNKLFIDCFRKKYEFFSPYIQPTFDFRRIIDLSNVMTIEQFIQVFYSNMTELFNCKSSEIWDFSIKQKPIAYREGKVVAFQNQDVGLAQHVYNKGQITNSYSCKIESSYSKEIDGTEDYPYIGIPYQNIVIMIRGNTIKPLFTHEDEIKLQSIAPYIQNYFMNALRYSQKPSLQPVLDLLQSSIKFLPVYHKERPLDAFVREAMIEIQKTTYSERVALFEVHDTYLESYYYTGVQNNYRFDMGQGIAGKVAKTGQEINLLDASSSEEFDDTFDKLTGYVTKTLLTVPIISSDGNVKSVIQMINKMDSKPFSKHDSLVATNFGSLCTLLMNNRELTTINHDLENRINQISISLTHIDFGMSADSFCKIARGCLNCKAVTIFVKNIAKDEYEKKGHDGIINIEYKEGGILDYALKANKTMLINDPFHEALCTAAEDRQKENILLIPICIEDEQFGVIQACNKANGFQDIDRFTLSCFSSIISNTITKRQMERVVKYGRKRLFIAGFVLDNELDQSIVPQTMQNKIDISTLDFKAYDHNSNVQLIAAIFTTFDSLGLLANVTSENLMSFINCVIKKYNNNPYHCFAKAISSMQMMYKCLNTNLKTIFLHYEMLSLITACILSSVHHDGTDDQFLIRMETADAITYNNKDIHVNQTLNKSLSILEKYKETIFSSDKQHSADEVIKMIVILLKSKDNYAQEVQEVLKLIQTKLFDVACSEHREMFLKCLFNMCVNDEFGRSTEICDKWEDFYSQERFILGDKEVENNLTYSTRHNCKELYDRKQCVSQEINELYDLFRVTCISMEKEDPLFSQVLENLEKNKKAFHWSHNSN